MLKIKIDKGNCEVTATGNLLQIGAEIGMAVARIYEGTKKTNPYAAEAFKELMQFTISDNSPVWE